MFTHVVPTPESCFAGEARRAIDHPFVNGTPNAILVVTNLGSTAPGVAQTYPRPGGVYYDLGPGNCPAGRWEIFSLSSTPAMTAGLRFRVFVINP